MEDSNWHAIETYKSLITISVEGFKSLILINGGALVAIIAYLGQSREGYKIASEMWIPFTLFSIGLISSTLTFVFSYRTQLTLYNETLKRAEEGSHICEIKNTELTVACSVVSFILGAIFSIRAISSLS